MTTALRQDVTQDLEDLLAALGGIAPGRIRLLRPFRTATEADLVAINAGKEALFELMDGFLVEKGMGFQESVIALVLAGYLRAFVNPRNLGLVSGANGMMRLVPGQVRVPDVAFTAWNRIPGQGLPTGPIAGFAPNLAVEILSPSNTRAEMLRKRHEYFAAGVVLVWEVDPATRSVAVYDSPEHATFLNKTQSLDGGAVLPGFALPLADLFGELDRRGA